MIWSKKIFILNFGLFLIWLIDRLFKWLAVSVWQEDSFIVISGFWQTKLFKNYYLSFNIPLNYPANLIIILPVFLIVVFFLIRAYQAKNLWLISSLSFIGLGALSNLIDRWRYGYVIDFINLNFGLSSQASFNLADLLIFIGISLTLIYFFLKKNQVDKK